MILADVDEIPSWAAFEAISAGQQGALEMVTCIFAVDWVWGPMSTSAVLSVEAARAHGSLSAARRKTWLSGPSISRGGHHLTWLGGADRVRSKLGSHCHTELNAATEAALDDGAFLNRGVNPFRFGGSPGDTLLPVDVDDTWPRWVAERRCPPGWFRPR